MLRLARRLSPLYSPLYEGYLREHLPRKYAVLNGVVTKSVRLLDPNDTYPNHKEANIERICELICADDRVVEIGAGYGVCTVWAARMASDGEVISYEASREMVDIARDAVHLNGDIHRDDLASRTDIRRGVVGKPEDVWGDMTDAREISPSEIETCDVLITDCEGSELNILRNLEIHPRAMIIEAHPGGGSPTESVIDVLRERGYRTTICEESRATEVDVVVGR